MKNTASNIDQVAVGAQGRFVSLLIGKGMNRTAHSAKIERVTPDYVYFVDINAKKAHRRVPTENVLRVACGKAIYSKVKIPG